MKEYFLCRKTLRANNKHPGAKDNAAVAKLTAKRTPAVLTVSDLAFITIFVREMSRDVVNTTLELNGQRTTVMVMFTNRIATYPTWKSPT